MHFTRSRRRALFLAIIALAGAILIGTLSPNTPTERSRAARGLLSVPTNMLSGLSPEVCTSTGLSLAVGATIDSSVTNGSCGSIKLPTASSCPITGDPLTNAQAGLQTSYNWSDGSFRGECPQTLGSSFTTGQYAVTPGAKYTFSAYMKSGPNAGTSVTSDMIPGDLDVIVQAFNSSGAPVAVDYTGGNTVIYDDWVNSAIGPWEESLVWFVAPSSAAYVRIFAVRFFPSTAPVTNLWVDDLYLGPGWVHRQEDSTKAGFAGTVASTDSLGNMAVKRTTGPTAGTQEPFFAKCIAPSGHRTDWAFYAGLGYNCIWTSAVFDYQPSSDWSSGSTSNPLARAKRATSASLPDGMRVMLDESIPIRGAFSFDWLNPTTHAPCTPYSVGCGAYGASTWTSDLPTKMATALTQIVSNGYADQLLGIIDDAEVKTSRRQRDRALNQLIDTTDRSLNSGQRRWPVISNMGLPGGARAARLNDGTTAYPALVGTYMAANNAGPLAKMQHEHNQVVPAGYCQTQSGLGNYRPYLYRCLGLGGKAWAQWSDAANTNPLYATSTGLALESETGYADFPNLFAEIDKLMPLIRQPIPSDWSVSSSNTAVEAYARSFAGTAYVFLINTSGSSQSTTLTFTGAGSPTSLAAYGWSTGVPDAGTTTVGSGLTVTLPATGTASGVGLGGGTLVLRAVGSSVGSPASTTTTGATTTSPATTTTTTTPPTSPSSHIDDTSFTCSPIASGASDESSGWKQYGPGFGSLYDPADYASSNRVTRLAGATCTVSFTGTAATLYGATGPSDGRFTVTLDGTPAGTTGCATVAGGKCETYAATSTRHVPVWSVSGLAVGTHTIVVTVDGTTYAPSTSAYVVMDELTVSSAADHLYAATLPTPPSIESGAAAVAANRINVNCNGTLTGVWWWRAAADTGTITVALWNTGGTLLASGSGDPAAGPGWRYLPFTTPAVISPGTTVVAGVLHPTGTYAYAHNGFTGRSVTSPTGCLSSPASVTGQLNGTYTYSSTLAFPTSSYLASEYFLSPSFTPGIPTGSVIFRDNFDSLDPSKDTHDIITLPGGGTAVGPRNYVRAWRQNDYWQNAEKGYIDFTGNHGNWNANKWETLNVAGGGTTTLNPFSVSGGVLSIVNAALPSDLQASVVAKANAQDQTPMVAPSRYGGFLVTDRDWINPTTGQPNVFKGGYYELRARFPDANGSNGKGLFPAWWLFASDESTNTENKGAAEIDIFEMFGFPAHSPITRTLHFGNNAPGSVTYAPHTLGTSDLDMSQWHTYALNWLLATDTGGPRLDFYLDGVLVNTVSGTEAAWFTTPMAMRINFAADANFIIGEGRATDASTAATARFDVDYVEVRAPLGTSPTTTTTAPSTTTTTSAGSTTTTSTTTSITTTTPPTTTTLAPQPCIIAGSYSATASTSSSASTAYALTDQTATGWTAASTSQQTITIDLGSDQTIGSIAFGWRARRAASSWVVDVRTANSSKWTRVSTASGYRTNGADQCLLRRLSARGRYVRVTTIRTEANLPVRLSEVTLSS